MIVKVNTHPIIVGAHEEYHIDWCGQIKDTHPKMENGKPIFYVRSKEGRVELNTINIKEIERVAKKMTCPCGRGSVTTDRAYIYILEENDEETLLGIVSRSHIKEYRQMYDSFEYN